MVWMGKRRRRRRRRERWRERMRKGARKYHPLPTKICLERSAHTLCTYFITTQMHEGFVYLLKVLLHSRTIHRSGKRRRPKKPFLLQQLRHRGGGIEERRRGRDALCLSFSFSPGERNNLQSKPLSPSPQPPIDVGTERGGEAKRGGRRGLLFPYLLSNFLPPSYTQRAAAAGGGEGGREAVWGGGGSLFVLLFSSSSSDAAAIVPWPFHRRRRRA